MVHAEGVCINHYKSLGRTTITKYFVNKSSGTVFKIDKTTFFEHTKYIEFIENNHKQKNYLVFSKEDFDSLLFNTVFQF